jgi:hypothetical protein
MAVWTWRDERRSGAEGAAASPTDDTVSSMPCVHTSAKSDRELPGDNNDGAGDKLDGSCSI